VIGKSHILWKLALGTGYAILIGGFIGWTLESRHNMAAASQRLPRMIVPHDFRSDSFEEPIEQSYEPIENPVFIADLPWIPEPASPSLAESAMAGRDANTLVVAVSGP